MAADFVAEGHLGLGWFRPASQRDADPPFGEHLGGGAGYFNVIRIYPPRPAGIVVMGNATRYDDPVPRDTGTFGPVPAALKPGKS